MPPRRARAALAPAGEPQAIAFAAGAAGIEPTACSACPACAEANFKADTRKGKPNPEQYYKDLKDAHAKMDKGEPLLMQRPVDRSKTSWLYQHLDVLRRDGQKLRITPQMLVFVYDLTTSEAMDVLDLTQRVFDSVKKWCGLTRWPYKTLMANTHPVLKLKTVRTERIKAMKRAFEGGDEFMYGMLYSAQKFSRSYPMDKFPTPAYLAQCLAKDAEQQAQLEPEPEPQPEPQLMEEVEPGMEPQSQPEDGPAAPPNPDDGFLEDLDFDYVFGWLDEEAPKEEAPKDD